MVSRKLTAAVVEGDKIEIGLGGHAYAVVRPAEAEQLAYDILDAVEEERRLNAEPTEAQLEAMNNPDSAPVRTEDTPRYRAEMRDAGRGGLLR